MTDLLARLGNIAGHYNLYIAILLMVAGLYVVIARGNMVKKLIGLSLFQSSVYLLYLTPGKILGGTAPVVDPRFAIYSNPLPHVLILTAIVVGIATLAVGLALVVRINEAYGSIEEDEIFARDEATVKREDRAASRPPRRAGKGAR
ncbi:cation:proton antiporter subunit C [Prosthecomicrobium pneumaticum]|uniref:Multicomponent Na+:H+ antiporter subunit C n=1 Tax=Prosthecomicrobium pneumaticum TaxID=81895 RepID=A0A7W9CU68_9HYPH|nr:cation:proton antiporter subunit C [Prosthecomicrobium pneumaticum]MBB5751719.1 multicomponent Na+:H+ antiporter subunit C [Prosthecomicrobium pneumaticum]